MRQHDALPRWSCQRPGLKTHSHTGIVGTVVPSSASIVIALAIFVFFLCACAPSTSHHEALTHLVPLHYAGGTISRADVDVLAPSPNLLGLDGDMREFVQAYTGHFHRDRQRMIQLHKSVISDAILDINYASDAEGGASEVFHRGTANCLSYANLFVALAREAGLNAQYQWVRLRPQWTRVGERISVRLHVNVVITLRSGVKYVVDIDPLTAAQKTRTRVLSDSDALALYHNNIAMEALARSDLEEAWAHNVRALDVNPDMSLLWVNLGAIYRLAGQHGAAERSYLRALKINPSDNSAMNNLVILYDLDGREADSKYWSDRVARYRLANPYYHAWLGDRAAEVDNWAQALMHYTDALRLDPKEPQLQYEMSVIYYQLGDLNEAARYIARAIKSTTLSADVAHYQLQLEAIKKEQLAGLN